MNNSENHSDIRDRATFHASVRVQRDAAIGAQPEWGLRPLKDRLQVVGRLAHLVARDHWHLAELILRSNATLADKLSSEIIPLADACRYVARRGERWLAPRRLPRRDGPMWLGRVRVTVHREPWGLILIIAPWNYPLFLPGVQLVQAIAAGNAVLVKPAPGCSDVLLHLTKLLSECGMPAGLVQILPTSIDAATEAIELGVDKVLLTGSSRTGRDVLRRLVDHLTPATMELSGCDAVFVLPDADLSLVADALAFGLRLNGGATCIAPRRAFITPREQAKLEPLLVERLSNCRDSTVHPSAWPALASAVEQAIEQGARFVVGSQWNNSSELQASPIVLADVVPNMLVARSDLFAPVLSLVTAENMTQALELNRACPYALSASVFGSPAAAEYWSRFIDVGCVTVNDLIVPTADPRVPFGGRGASGYGVTRGLEGLLEMTRPKVVCTRLGKWWPHLKPQTKHLDATLVGLMKLSHGGSLQDRMAGLVQLVASLKTSNSRPCSSQDLLDD